jgi:hypothetical protein
MITENGNRGITHILFDEQGLRIMTNGVGIIGSTPGVSLAPTAAAAVTTAGSSTFAVGNQATAVSLQNPRVVLDPSAGFVTQYLSANGSQVISQTPSAITVAYLRLGLTSDGLPKQSAQVGTTA